MRQEIVPKLFRHLTSDPAVQETVPAELGSLYRPGRADRAGMVPIQPSREILAAQSRHVDGQSQKGQEHGVRFFDIDGCWFMVTG